jgi:hypothetical protein
VVEMMQGCLEKVNFAFIDGQNLNLGIQRLGWKLDLKRFNSWTI